MKIVIVEDEAAIRNGMGNILKKLNPAYELVGKASNGIEGLEMIRKEKPDLVILDIRMPDMDGLEMLKVLRQENNGCRAVVLTAYSDFDYAKTAIELGIENYLLKPVKLKELEETLKLAEKRINEEKEQKKKYSLESALTLALAETPETDTYMKEQLMEKYGFDADGNLGIFFVWLGERFQDYAEEIYSSLKEAGRNSGIFSSCALKREKRDLVMAVLYRMPGQEEAAAYIETKLASVISGQTGGRAVMGLHFCHGLKGLSEAAAGLFGVLDYSLTGGGRELIYYDKILEMGKEPFKYPLELETRVKQAVAGKNSTEISRCVDKFIAYCKAGDFHPAAVKEACFRYFSVVFHAAREYGRIYQTDLPVARRMQEMMEAVTWQQIKDVFSDCMSQIEGENEEQDESLLVRKARILIGDYYNQGITLEEIADKLGVSGEYLSTRLKKETGMTFTETMKKVRIERIKELLVSTSLKLNQIADQAGYSDPKYMSRIFREETGMLPSEYRKTHL